MLRPEIVAERQQQLARLEKHAVSKRIVPTSYRWHVMRSRVFKQYEVGVQSSTTDGTRLLNSVGYPDWVNLKARLVTQRPTSDSVDVGTRALTTYRFALKCGDRHQAEAILGVGTFASDQLLSAVPGRALWSDGGSASAVQFYNLTDERLPFVVYAGLRV